MPLSYYQALSCEATRKCALPTIAYALFDRCGSPVVQELGRQNRKIMIDSANDYILPNPDKWKEPTMARRSIEERISQLEAQRKTLQARLGKQDRAKDTRRKILLGALVLYRLEKSGDEEFSKG